MDNLTKVKINLKAGTIELEGSEEFVQKNLDIFKDFIFKSKKPKELDANIEKGVVDANIDNSHSKIDRIKVLRSIISELQKEHKGGASLQDIIKKAEETGIKKEIILDMIQKLKDVGIIIESAENKFRVV